MPKASLDALLSVYREQVVWLEAQADQLETGSRRIMAQGDQGEIDLSSLPAIEYRHKAGNMKAIIAAYERLHT
jgi:hypothetical protein